MAPSRAQKKIKLTPNFTSVGTTASSKRRVVPSFLSLSKRALYRRLSNLFSSLSFYRIVSECSTFRQVVSARIRGSTKILFHEAIKNLVGYLHVVERKEMTQPANLKPCGGRVQFLLQISTTGLSAFPSRQKYFPPFFLLSISFFSPPLLLSFFIRSANGINIFFRLS